MNMLAFRRGPFRRRGGVDLGGRLSSALYGGKTATDKRMVRLWFKVMKNDRIVRQTVYEKDEKFTYSLFHDYISAGCYELDLSTPLIVKNHLFNFAKYNGVKFLPDDFTEPVDFDRLVVENLDR